MITAVIPVYNEQESLDKFYPRLKNALSKIDKNHEIIFVDDGSTDSSFEIIKKLAAKDNTIKIYSFRKNQGKSEGLTYGFKVANGDYIVTLDADLQDRPEEIENLLKKSKEGFDLVSGWRKNRKDAIYMKLPSKLFNLLMSAFWGVHLHDYNCGLKLYKKDAAKSLSLYGGMHRFIPLLVSEKGFEVTEIAVVHDPRKFGKSKYGFSKLWNDLPDIFTMLFLTRYSKRPLHFFGPVGFTFLIIGGAALTYLFVLKIMGQGIGDRPLLFLGILLVLSGFQVLFTGFLADIIINTSNKEAKDFPIRYSSEK